MNYCKKKRKKSIIIINSTTSSSIRILLRAHSAQHLRQCFYLTVKTYGLLQNELQFSCMGPIIIWVQNSVLLKQKLHAFCNAMFPIYCNCVYKQSILQRHRRRRRRRWLEHKQSTVESSSLSSPPATTLLLPLSLPILLLIPLRLLHSPLFT